MFYCFESARSFIHTTNDNKYIFNKKDFFTRINVQKILLYMKYNYPSSRVIFFGEPPVRFLWCWLSSLFCCCSLFANVFHSHFLFDIILHPSADYRQVFTPMLYSKPSPLQSDSWQFHFQPLNLYLYQSILQKFLLVVKTLIKM